jgi:hypothetical protein
MMTKDSTVVIYAGAEDEDTVRHTEKYVSSILSHPSVRIVSDKRGGEEDNPYVDISINTSTGILFVKLILKAACPSTLPQSLFIEIYSNDDMMVIERLSEYENLAVVSLRKGLVKSMMTGRLCVDGYSEKNVSGTSIIGYIATTLAGETELVHYTVNVPISTIVKALFKINTDEVDKQSVMKILDKLYE